MDLDQLALEIEMMRVDRAYRELQEAVERQKHMDFLENLYETWDKDFKAYWNQFSEAYRSGSEFYTESLPPEVFWALLTGLVQYWLQKELLEVD